MAKDGLAVYLHAQNPLSELTIAQLRDVYTGAITKWKALGGPEAPIVSTAGRTAPAPTTTSRSTCSRGPTSRRATQTLPGTAAVVNAVSKDPNGIGYGGGAYAKGVKECGIKADAQSAAQMPTADNVRSGAYPISRDLYFYLRAEPQGPAKEFIDFALSEEGQKTVIEVGYYPR